MHIQHLTLRVKDLEKSIRFYELVTELKVIRQFSEGAASLAFLSNGEGETELELLHIPGGQTFEGKGLFICFKTNKLDEQHQFVIEQNLNPSPIQTPMDGSRYFYVYDPDGFSVQLREFPEISDKS